MVRSVRRPSCCSDVSADTNAVAVWVGQGELVHAPGLIDDWRGVEASRDETCMPVIDIIGDDVAAGVVRGPVKVGDEIEIEHALIVEIDECEPVVVPAHLETCRRTEPHRFSHVGHRKRRCHIDRPNSRAEPADTGTADLDVVVTQQGRHRRLVAILTAA